MAKADVVFRIVVDGKNTIIEAVSSTKKLREEIDKTTQSQNKANASSENLRRTQERGVYGTANNARNFSKLSQTIGSGDNGLVGAYATLAANTFAVVAAFTALQRASDSLKIMAGLEAQGARLGQTLSITAKGIREVTKDAVSMKQAMASTAQLTAGGFGQNQILELTKVATNASGALGRDLADAMDRLTRGVTKLEPELLDELGIMTKIDEASRKYAVANNKAAASLTAAEKRQAFMNAVLDEGERKFGGIGEAVDQYNAYSRLAAASTDLFNTSIGALSVVLAPVAEFFASSDLAIVAAIVLFASTIKDQLIPSLSKAAILQKALVEDKQADLVGRAESFAEKAAKVEDAQYRQGPASRRDGRPGFLPMLGADELNDLTKKITEGTVASEDFSKAQEKLGRQLTSVSSRMADAATSAEEFDQILNNKETLMDAYERIGELASAHYEKEAAVSASTAMDLAQNVTLSNLIPTLKGVGVQLAMHFRSLQAASAATATATAGTRSFAFALSSLKNAAATAAVGIRVLGVAALNLLPIIGQIMFFLSLFSGALEYINDLLTSKESKAYATSLSELTEITAAAADKAREYSRAQEMAVTNATSQIAALKLTGNAVEEVSAKFDELMKNYEKSGSEGFFANLFRAATLKDLGPQIAGDSSSEALRAAADALPDSSNVFRNVKEFENLGASLDSLATIYGVVNDQNKAYIDSRVKSIDFDGEYQEVAKAVGEVIKTVSSRTKNLSLDIEGLAENYKNLEDATTSYIQSATQSTPVDQLLKTLSSSNASIEALRIQMQKGAIDSVAFGRSLTTLGAQSKNLLGESLVDIIDFDNLNAQITALQDKKADGQKIDESALYNLTKQSEILATKIGPEIQKTLRAREEEIRNIQVGFRLNKQILELEKSRFKVVSDLFDVGAEGFLAREAHEEKLRNFQATELDMEATILKVMQTQAQVSIEALKRKQAELQIQLIMNSLFKESLDTQVLSSKLGDAAALGPVGKLSLFAEINEQGAQSSERVKQIQTELATVQSSIDSASDSMRDLNDAISSLEIQKSAILAQNLTKAQLAAKAAGEEFKVTQEFMQQIEELSNAQLSVTRKIADFNRIISGQNNQILDSALEAKRAYEDTRRTLIQNLALKATELKIVEKNVSAGKARGTLDALQLAAADRKLDVAQAELYNAEQILKVKLQEAEVTAKLEILRSSIFDVTKNTLEWQQQALSYMQKEAELAGDILEKQQGIVDTQIERARIQSGLPTTDQTNRNDEVRAATQAFAIAKARAQTQISVIDAEYALLEAQKAALQIELKTRLSILRTFPGMSEEFLAPLQKAVSVLDSVNVGKLRDQAVEGIRLSVELEGEKLATAVARANAPTTNEGLVGQLGAFRRDMREREEATAKALNELAAPFILASEVTLPTTLKTGVENLEQGIVDALVQAEANGPAARMADDVRDIAEVVTGKKRGNVSLTDPLGGKGTITSGYGARNAPKAGASTYHQGIDIGAKAGTPIYATVDGTVTDARYMNGYGNTVKLDGGDIDTLSAHMSEILVKVGQRVKAGDIIGRVGSTGNSTGPHLHYEVSINGKKVDPRTLQGQPVPINIEARVSNSSTATGVSVDDVKGTAEALAEKYPAAFADWNVSAEQAKLTLTEITSQTLDLSGIVEQMKSMDPFYRMAQGARDFRQAFALLSTDIMSLAQKMGPEGEIITALGQGLNNIALTAENAFSTIAESNKVLNSAGATEEQRFAASVDKWSAMGAVASQVFSTISSITQAASDARVRGIEAEIAAEQKRDGKSLESQKKIEALEKKKEQVQRKQFNLNKKMMMAQAVIATATGIAQALTLGPIVGPIMAAVIGAMGAAQIALIAGTSFQGGSSSAPSTSTPSSITIGRAGSSVNLDKPNANAGGEIGYLRGSSGTGGNSSNFRTIGSAYGGMTDRGYGHRAFLVGEKGPETIETSEPMKVKPSMNSGESGNTFIVQAIDAKSFEEMLENNPGPIIQGLQRVANSNGKPFMEGVDTRSFGGKKR